MHLLRRHQPATLEACVGCEAIVPTLRALHANRQLTVLFTGPAAVGKTTLVQATAALFSPSAPPSSSGNDTILQVSAMHEHGLQFFRTEVAMFCKSARRTKVLLLDDLDLIPDSCQHVLRALLQKAPDVQVVASCTSLAHVLPSLHAQWWVVPLTPLTEDHRHHLWQRACAAEGVLGLPCPRWEPTVKAMLHHLERHLLLNKQGHLGQEGQPPTSLPMSAQMAEWFDACLRHDLTAALTFALTWWDQGYTVLDMCEEGMTFLTSSAADNTGTQPDRYRWMEALGTAALAWGEGHDGVTAVGSLVWQLTHEN